MLDMAIGNLDPARTEEDYAVWHDYLRLLEPSDIDAKWKLPAYSEAIFLLSPNMDRIPCLSEINAWLEPTQWKAAYYSGFVPAKQYADLQANGIFPISSHIRKMRDLSHSAAPDFLHDLFGHLPMLFNKNYSDLVKTWAAARAQAEKTDLDAAVALAQDQLIAAMEETHREDETISALTVNLQNAQAISCNCASRAGRLERFYTWSLEYGLLSNEAADNTKIVGAAILSSLGEKQRVLTGQVNISPFHAEILDRPVNYTIFQDEMFSVRDFSDYLQILKSI